jgi:hypothetical protein
MGVPIHEKPSYNSHVIMRWNDAISNHSECWLDSLVCPRRYRAFLPSQVRPFLFGAA